jgi:hypothetical protein
MPLKLDQKYFKPSVIGAAIFLTFVIAVYSVDYAEKQQQHFVDVVKSSAAWDTLAVKNVRTGEMVRFDSLRGQPLVLVFFAGWSERSMSFLSAVEEHAKSRGGSGKVIGLLVKDQPDQIADFLTQHPDLTVANGTELYGALKVSGIPAAIVFGKEGKVRLAFTGDVKSRIPELFDGQP